MLGISKCLHGTFRIVSLDIKELKCTENGGYVYRKSLERVEMLSYDGPLTTSVIFPDSFNIHRIEAMELSAFFDLLIPDYPED